MQLKGKVAPVTGAGSGIGKAATLLFVKEGAKVAAVGHTADELDETVGEAETFGEVLGITADISNADEMQCAVSGTIENFKSLDIVFANAGINGVWAPIEDLEPDEWDKTLETNLKGTFLTIKYAIPHLQQRGGAILITSSVNGTRIFSNTDATVYSCSKTAQVALAKMAAFELAKHRIRVNVICSGAIATGIDDSTEKRGIEREVEPVEYPNGKIPLTDGESATAEQVARLALFLVSDAASHISVRWSSLNGYKTLSPPFVFTFQFHFKFQRTFVAQT